MRWVGACIMAVGVLAFVLVNGQVDAQTTSKPDWKTRFQEMDTSKDGRLDRAEFHAWMVDVFYHRDRARKGYLTLDDVKGIMAPETFAAASRAGDGKLRLGEFLNTLFRDFDAIDTNKNGAITAEEIEAYIRTARK